MIFVYIYLNQSVLSMLWAIYLNIIHTFSGYIIIIPVTHIIYIQYIYIHLYDYDYYIYIYIYNCYLFIYIYIYQACPISYPIQWSLFDAHSSSFALEGSHRSVSSFEELPALKESTRGSSEIEGILWDGSRVELMSSGFHGIFHRNRPGLVMTFTVRHGFSMALIEIDDFPSELNLHLCILGIFHGEVLVISI